MSNFAFLAKEWSELLETAQEAEKNVYLAPRTCCFYSRFTLERAVKWLYKHDPDLHQPYDDNLSALIHEQTFKDNLRPDLFPKIKTIHKIGNLAVHSSRPIGHNESVHVLRELHHFLYWLYRDYTGETSPTNVIFDQALLPQAQPASDLTLKQLKELDEKRKQQEAEIEAKKVELLLQEAHRKAELQEKEALLQKTEEEKKSLLKKLLEYEEKERKQQVEENKARNQTLPDPHDYNEAETRKYIIDLLLQEAGWNPGQKEVQEYEVEGMPYGTGKGYVDYVLWGDNGLPLAVVEAKKTTKDATAGKHQAKLYADCLEKMKGQRPVIFYTNGYETYLWDDLNYPPRLVQGFYKKDELGRLIEARQNRKSLSKAPINKNISGRYYQEAAIRYITESFEHKNRKALLVMATGTGKTRTVISLIELLQKQGWVKNVLFLADRNALLHQAKQAFAEHLPHSTATIISSSDTQIPNRICLSTYQTMIHRIDEAKMEGSKLFSPGHFELLVIDEAHRSIYRKYKAIFDYFDSLLVGLTATPKDEVDRNTYSLFDLESGVPTYAYESEQAWQDGFLVPPKAFSVPLKFHREGIKYAELSEEEKEDYEMTFENEETGELPESIDSSALNQWLFNEDTVDKVLKHLMENGIKVEGGDRLGKTVIFAKNHKHAEFIQKRFDANYPHLMGHFTAVIDNYNSYAQSLIDSFKVEKSPTIAVSVDMMDTGIDVPEIVNLVFFKMVRSKSKFTQMIGRGTRLCHDLFGLGVDKTHFLIFDYCENFEFFQQTPEGVKPSKQVSLSDSIFIKRLKIAHKLSQAEDPQQKELRTQILNILHHEIAHMNKQNCIVRPKLKFVEKYDKRETWNELTAEGIAEIEEHLMGLPSEIPNEDYFAKRFDSLILSLQMSLLTGAGNYSKNQSKVVEIASQLEEKRSIPMVNVQMELILELQTDDFWQDMTLPILEDVRTRIRNLAHFIDKQHQNLVYTDFEDTIGDVKEIDTVYITASELKQYRLKVESFIRKQENHLVIQKLKRNLPITSVDLQMLETLLFSSEVVGNKETFDKAFELNTPLSVFIRRLIGLDREAAKQEFARYLDEHFFNARQIEFINKIINYLTQNGVMEIDLLYQSPFTDMHHESVDGLFPEKDADTIVNIIKHINDNARLVA
ncbi:MAG: DEAD/DEAH box helicase family protein [SAR324 cluster bacterium]|nr:DEAD/DEAH box helicase family protein [SAR324 cluster bacterium]